MSMEDKRCALNQLSKNHEKYQAKQFASSTPKNLEKAKAFMTLAFITMECSSNKSRL